MACEADRIIAVTGMAFEARIAREGGMHAICAARADLLERALSASALRGGAGIISFGTAGGLAPGLAPGTLIIANAIHGPSGRVSTDDAWTQRLMDTLALIPGIACAALAGVNAPVTSTAEKAALYQATGALAVDMESHIAQAVAATHGLPFTACRVIADPSERSLPRAATVALRADGTVALGAVLGELFRQPSQLGALFTLAADARVARRTLIHVSRVLAQH